MSDHEAPGGPGHQPLLPVITARCTVRPLHDDDLDAVVGFRRDPEVSRYQNWPSPYPEEHARSMVDGSADPIRGAWIAAVIEHDGTVVGDLGIGLTADAMTASLGYTLARSAQGRGLASEAVAGVVDRLFATGVHRIVAEVDPENRTSARLLERLGFRHEGTAVRAELVRGEWLDNDHFALLAEDRRGWLARPSGPPAEVRLAEMTDEMVMAVYRLRTHRYEERYVSPMAMSYLDALFPEEVDAGYPEETGRRVRTRPWMRAVLADEDVVGFVMLADPDGGVDEPYLWRLLIDRRHQRRGIGARVVEAVVADLRARGFTTLLTSWALGPGAPQPFYLGLGFVPTGHLDDGEVVGRLMLPAD